MIEFTHRISSGLTILLIFGLAYWTWKRFSKSSMMRWSAGLSVAFILSEALLGAGLVLFELVAKNASITRAFAMMAHLINTFMLLACLSITAWWARFGIPERLRWGGKRGGWLVGGALGIIFLVRRDGQVIAVVPDLISMLDVDTAEPTTTETIRYGFRVAVIGMPAHPLLRTPEALEVIGPKAFGYPDVIYQPM
jgi:DUF917 family protein